MAGTCATLQSWCKRNAREVLLVPLFSKSNVRVQCQVKVVSYEEFHDLVYGRVESETTAVEDVPLAKHGS